MKRSDFFLFVAVLFVLLTACSPTSGKKGSEGSPSPSLSSNTPSQTASEKASAASTALAALPLQQTVWAWQYTLQNGARQTPATPTRYTLIFDAEGRLGVTADCNRGGTSYRIQNDRMTLDLVAMTKMLCPAGSLDRVFLEGLGKVERYRIDDKTLTLLLQQGGEMVFAPGSP